MESICNKLNSAYTEQYMVSPVADSIKLDTLQTIQDRCEAIEKNILALDAMIKVSLNNSTLPLNSERIEVADNSSVNEHSFGIGNYGDERRLRSSERTSFSEIPNSESLDILPNLSNFNQEVYVSRLPTVTTCDDVKNYILRKSSIDMRKVKIHRLTKKHQDISKLTFISFKIETDDVIAKQLLDTEFWPRHVLVKIWKSKREHIAGLIVNQSSDDFLSRTNSERPKI